ncbi:MAG TPA: hypothetical protein VK474_08975 [Chthoniobacterales bacterium]|nr:hypothetical protein [Chthoniobacterales bacterium]
MNDPVLVRRKLREVLAMALRRRFSEEMLLDALNRLLPDKTSVAELRTALEWNHARGWIEYRHNEEEERDEWFLTDAGKQKQGL